MTHAVDATYESLLEIAPDAMLGVDDTGAIRFVNRQTELLFGYSREELVGQQIETLVPESFREHHPGHRQDYFAAPETRAMGAGLALAGRRSDGTTFPVDITLSSIATEGGLLVTAAVRDISDRMWERRLERVAAIIDCSEDAIVAQSLTGIVESWNPAAERLYGYTASEARGMPQSVLVPPGHVDDVLEILAKVSRGERVDHYETTRINKNGRIIDVSVSASPTRDSRGTLLGATTIARDITERKRTESMIQALNADLERRVDQRTAQLADAVEDLEAFSHSVAHDLRAPLRAIDGFSRAVLNEYGDILDAEGRRLLKVIRRSTTDMAELIDDLLEFSRVGRQPIVVADIDMPALTASVVDELSATYADRKLTVSIGDLPHAEGDAKLVRQVLLNLLSNSIKFTELTIPAQITVSGDLQDGRRVFRVRDNGVGFDPVYHDKMFQVFQRLHHTEFAGTGLGLAIVQRIVRRHGGQVWADGKVGEGAEFSFTLDNAEDAA